MPAQQQLFKRAKTLYEQGDLLTARRLLCQVLHDDPTNQQAWIWFAETHRGKKQRGNVYRQALEEHPEMRHVEAAYKSLAQRQLRQFHFVIPLVDYTTVRQADNRLPKSQMATVVSKPGLRYSLSMGKLAWVMFLLASIIVMITLVASTVLSFQRLDSQTKENVALRSENLALERTYSEAQQKIGQFELSLRTLRLDFENLSTQYTELQQRYSSLTSQHADLTYQYDDLTQKHNGLVVEHNQLIQHTNELEAQYQSLQTNYTLLNQQNEVLQNHNNELSRNYNDLRQIALVPPYITIQQREVTAAFYRLDQSILYWRIPFESLENDILRGTSSRRWFPLVGPKVSLKVSDDEKYTAPDFRAYVDSSLFQSVITDLYRQSPDEETFIRQVWYIISQLTTYTDEGNSETPRYPFETLLAGGGDCEDTAILFASMIKAAPTDWEISLVYMNGKNPTVLSQPNHVAVQVKTSTRTYLVETTSESVMEPYYEGIAAWFLKIY